MLAVCIALGVGAPVAASTPPSPMPASLGSVPSEISRYASDPDGLLARLDDLFGVTTSGQGIEFGDTTTVGPLNRAWVFTEAWLGGGAGDDPVELANLWTAPILIAEKPVGLATIWVNPATEAPDLADFERSASSAAALVDVPAESHLVRDEPRAAWFTLAEGQLTPLVPGDSGVDAPTSLAAYQRFVTSDEPVPATGPNLDGMLAAGLVAGAAVLAVLVVLLLPMLRRRAGDADPDAVLGTPTAAIPIPVVAESPAVAPVAAPEPQMTKSPATKTAVTKTVTKTAAKPSTAKATPGRAKPTASKANAATETPKPAAAKKPPATVKSTGTATTPAARSATPRKPATPRPASSTTPKKPPTPPK